MPVGIVYKGFRLTFIDQPAGGYRIEITPLAGGESVLTETFRRMASAMAAARQLVDNGTVAPDD